jgi:protein-S-isoprenylcysteine O-methyltransferase Ste14
MHFFSYCWAIAVLVWLAMTWRAKKAVRAESDSARWLHLFLTGAGFALLGSLPKEPSWLHRQFASPNPTLFIIGAALAVVGIAYAIWARLYLGHNWSSAVMIQQDHELIRSGPYRFHRHPIYAGFLVAACGTALAHAEWLGFLGCALLYVTWRFKAHREEHLLAAQFGEDYAAYRREVPGLP